MKVTHKLLYSVKKYVPPTLINIPYIIYIVSVSHMVLEFQQASVGLHSDFFYCESSIIFFQKESKRKNNLSLPIANHFNFPQGSCK